MIIRGDATRIPLPDCSVDAVVTDPPAGISFMSKRWDTHGTLVGFQDFLTDAAMEMVRVMKPGAHALVWALPRTCHHTGMALERAGLDVRDVVTHLFGSGFPKSHNLDGEWAGWGTALKPAAEFWFLARKPLTGTVAQNVLRWGTGALNIDGCRVGNGGQLKWSSPRGMGSEPFADDSWTQQANAEAPSAEATENPAGRWPPNVALGHSPDCDVEGVHAYVPNESDGRLCVVCDRWPHSPLHGVYEESARRGLGPPRCAPDCAVRLLDEQSGERTSGGGNKGNRPGEHGWFGLDGGSGFDAPYVGDTGGASRFFYVAKASRAERNAGLEGMPDGSRPAAIEPKSRQCNVCGTRSRQPGKPWPACGHEDWQWVEVRTDPHKGRMANSHPTVKPLALMRWLVRLVTPPGGLVLDPFLGSGTTLLACAHEGMRGIGIEREAEYVEIAKGRLSQPIQGGML